MYACMCIYFCKHVFVYPGGHTSLMYFLYIYFHVCMCVCVPGHVCGYVHVPLDMCTCICVSMHTLLCWFACVCVLPRQQQDDDQLSLDDSFHTGFNSLPRHTPYFSLPQVFTMFLSSIINFIKQHTVRIYASQHGFNPTHLVLIIS